MQARPGIARDADDAAESQSCEWERIPRESFDREGGHPASRIRPNCTLRKQEQLIKQMKDTGTWSVDGGDDGAPGAC